MSALIPRSTVVEMEAHRARALELYGQTFDTLQEAAASHGAAVVKGWSLAVTLSTGRYQGDRQFGLLSRIAIRRALREWAARQEQPHD